MKYLRFLVVAASLAMTLGLAGCGQTPLLSNVGAGGSTPAIVRPNGSGQAATIAYNVGQPAKVSVYLFDSAGNRYVLRENVERVPADEPYTLRFNGTVPGDDLAVVQRVLPNGTYRYVVHAETTNGQTAEQDGQIEIQDAATAPLDKMVEDLHVEPQVVTPNEDAIDDVATFAYRLPITATVSIALQSPTDPNPIPFITDLKEGPYEQSHIWDGKRSDGSLLDSGVYTYTVTARDDVGNIVARRGQVRIESPGKSEAQITYFRIAPTEIELGGVITATIKIKNTGNVPIRTQGPASGYPNYSTNQSFASIENEQWAAKPGLWRVGVGYDAGGEAYPFRWALTQRPPQQWAEPGKTDILKPGEEVTITGTIQLKERRDKIYFFAGLAHEGVGYPVTRRGITLIKVGF